MFRGILPYIAREGHKNWPPLSSASRDFHNEEDWMDSSVSHVFSTLKTEEDI